MSGDSTRLTAVSIVEQNISSALILEGDVDWDIRIKSQMRDFARASRRLIQPSRGTTNTFLDPTYPSPRPDQEYSDFDIDADDPTTPPHTSPYGDLDRWDVLWLGHCGARFPRASDMNTPLGRVIMSDDDTVPEPENIDVEWGEDELLRQYPPHTRVVSRARMNTCSFSYGVSQDGARSLLYELGIHHVNDPTDIMLRAICDGTGGRRLLKCLTVQPTLFSHHRPKGSQAHFSDISDTGNGMNDHAFTHNIQWSMRVNFPKLVAGETDYVSRMEKRSKMTSA